MWDVAAGDPFTGHHGWVRAVAVAELDGRPVAVSGSDDHTVRVWDLARRRPVRRILRAVRLRHSSPVLTAVLHHHHDRVSAVTGCSDGTVLTWDLSARRPLARAPFTRRRSTLSPRLGQNVL
ncbi:MAG: hypothetical protein ACRDYX_02890 [Egibacteraceae bacterium]